jgi:hypothetical protein
MGEPKPTFLSELRAWVKLLCEIPPINFSAYFETNTCGGSRCAYKISHTMDKKPS